MLLHLAIWIGVFILVWCSSFFSSCETAISSLNKIRIKKMAADGNKRAELVLKLSENYGKVLTALLIGNNILNIFVSTIGAVIFTSYFGAWGAGISTIFFTFVVLIFAEIIPKTIAKVKAEAICLKKVKLIYFFMFVFMPIIFLCDKIRNLIGNLKKLDNQPTITEPELKFMLEEIQNQGILEDREGKLVSSALDLDEIQASQIMTPRVDLVAIEINTSIENIKNIFLNEKFSRLPVYEENIDNVVGFVNEKDFFKIYLENKNFNLRDILKKAFLVPAHMNVSEIMRYFQQGEPHMAIVVDQYGGVEGLITFVDVIEQLFGEIYDEKDDREKNIKKIGDNKWLINPSVSVDEMFEAISKKSILVETRSNTVGGWIFEVLNKVPRNGDSFEFNDFKIIVKKMEQKRISKVLIIRNKT